MFIAVIQSLVMIIIALLNLRLDLVFYNWIVSLCTTADGWKVLYGEMTSVANLP